jgi:hypothetical protein
LLNIDIPRDTYSEEYLNFDCSDNKNNPKQIQITTKDLSVNDINIVLDIFRQYNNFSFKIIKVEDISSACHFHILKSLSYFAKKANIVFSNEISDEKKVHQ